MSKEKKIRQGWQENLRTLSGVDEGKKLIRRHRTFHGKLDENTDRATCKEIKMKNKRVYSERKLFPLSQLIMTKFKGTQ